MPYASGLSESSDHRVGGLSNGAEIVPLDVDAQACVTRR